MFWFDFSFGLPVGLILGILCVYTVQAGGSVGLGWQVCLGPPGPVVLQWSPCIWLKGHSINFTHEVQFTHNEEWTTTQPVENNGCIMSSAALEGAFPKKTLPR